MLVRPGKLNAAAGHTSIDSNAMNNIIIDIIILLQGDKQVPM